jgi:CDP-paratose 2-epimerase
VLGYKGKQVRDNLHSSDLVRAFDVFFAAPRCGEVYNIGGSCFSNCSMLEAIALCEQITGQKLSWKYVEANRAGDHMWWISDISRFQSHYPSFQLKFNVAAILREMHERNAERWQVSTRTTYA